MTQFRKVSVVTYHTPGLGCRKLDDAICYKASTWNSYKEKYLVICGFNLPFYAKFCTRSYYEMKPEYVFFMHVQ